MCARMDWELIQGDGSCRRRLCGGRGTIASWDIKRMAPCVRKPGHEAAVLVHEEDGGTHVDYS